MADPQLIEAHEPLVAPLLAVAAGGALVIVLLLP
jgi:hypothetical protein